jgi:hypothetical protein
VKPASSTATTAPAALATPSLAQSSVKQDIKHEAEKSKKEAVKEFKKAEASVQKSAEKMIVKAQKKGVDIESLVEKNNKLWK